MRQRRRFISGFALLLLVAAALLMKFPAGDPGPGGQTAPHRRFRGHSGVLREVAFAPDSRSLATSSVDGTVKLWSVPDGRLTRVLAHPHGVTSVDFSADGRWLATGSYDGMVRIWRLSDGTLQRTLA